MSTDSGSRKAMSHHVLYAAIAALTLGLAPFAPEPHIVGKLRWVFGGANGMRPMDWFDLFMHGAPWVWLGVSLVRVLARKDPRPVLIDLSAALVAILAACVCVAWALLQ